jgi:hypothetical protein
MLQAHFGLVGCCECGYGPCSENVVRNGSRMIWRSPLHSDRPKANRREILTCSAPKYGYSVATITVALSPAPSLTQSCARNTTRCSFSYWCFWLRARQWRASLMSARGRKRTREAAHHLIIIILIILLLARYIL